MKTITNNRGTKEVRIRKNENEFTACYVQIFFDGASNSETLLQLKSFKTEKAAIKWADKTLN